MIAGPHDPTNRFTYWPARMAQGGEVLAPGDPELPVQYIDARDEAAWIVHMAERGGTGRFNVAGPETPLTLGGLLERCRAIAGNHARLTWVAGAFLAEQGVEAWTDLPLWLPADLATLPAVPISRALAAGLRLRPVDETIADTLAWAGSEQGERSKPQVAAGGRVRTPAGMSGEREAELLRVWHQRLG